jgi:hypothetical protein
MIWFFERGDQAVELETRFDRDAREYVLTITWPDARALTERYRALDEFRTRVDALQRELDAERWTQRGSPTLITGDWWSTSN